MSDPVSETTIRTPEDEEIRALAVRMAQAVDVNADRAETAIRSLIARGLIKRSAESHG